ncbi:MULTISPECIES: AfsR/SARP family transcriptional regulator [Actinosynnema]|uniref:AfsR/SARP family transcriptional regulator n=1 Tax=Actinosynnema TaxID=40566 RepID=UPI0020A5C2D7|nr:AfsR/SARP family transcriptional regulator [Actinosynnema pretiosum]MCP2099573.1 DNA-binding transcriptional activator of the SARP family [Actinosynnema pretiosum]
MGWDLGIGFGDDEFGVLGPLLVRRGGVAVAVTAPKQRIVLASLVMGANRAVSSAELVRAVWGERAPARAAHTLAVYVMRLRRALGEPQLIHTTPSGYLIDLPHGSVDLHRFADHAAHGALAASAKDFGSAVEHYQRALDCWRGPALADVPSEALHADEAPALVEEQLRVTAELVDARLRLGHGAELVPDLRRLTARHPLRERFWSQLMVALHRADRQADALDAYRQASTALARELGVDPGESLRAVHHSVLTGDPALRGPLPSGWSPVSQLPAPVGNFVGRADELDLVTSLLGEPTAVVAVCGPPGVGKTAFAVTVGHAVRERYHHGQLYADLRGHSTLPPLGTATVLARFLRALGARPDSIPVDEAGLVRAYRERLRGRRVLITLDNAASAAQVLPLLPDVPECSVVITSRNELGGDVGAAVVRLDVLRHDEAWTLLTRSLAPEAADEQGDALRELARLCGYLPLALRIALGNLVGAHTTDIRSYVDDLRGGDRLSALAVPDDDSAAVRRAFDLSHAALRPDAAKLFRLTGSLPGPDFSAFGAAALLGADEATARALTEELAAANLLQRVGDERFAVHDLLHEYAAERAHAAGDDLEAARGRLFDWYLSTASAVGDVLFPEVRPARANQVLPDAAAARAWLAAERPSLLAATEQCARRGPLPMAWSLVEAVGGFLGSHGHHGEFLNAVRAAGDAARAADDAEAEGVVLAHVVAAHRNLGDLGAARSAARGGNPVGRAVWLLAGAAGVVALDVGELAEAEARFREVVGVSGELTHARCAGVIGLGAVRLARGELDAAEELLREGHGLALRVGAVNLAASGADLRGRCRGARGDHPGAVRWLREARDGWARTGARPPHAETTAHLAAALCLAGEHGEALRTAQRALALVQGLGGSPRIEADVHNALGLVQRHLANPEAAVAAHLRALELSGGIGYRHGVVQAHVLLAPALLAAGRRADAVRHARIGLGLAEETGYGGLRQAAESLLAALG